MSGPHWVCPAHGVCVFLVYTAQILGCSARKLSKVGPGLRALPRSKPLRFRYSPKAQTRLGLRFVPCPGLSSSGDQVLGQRTLSRWMVHLITFPVPVPRFPWMCNRSPISGMLCVSSGELISGCDPLGGCQPYRIPGRLG